MARRRHGPAVRVTRWAGVSRLARALPVAALAGCAGEQSALDPIGSEASSVAALAIVLFVGGAVVLALVVVLAALAVLRSQRARRWLATERAVLLGGLVLPALVLTALLVYGLTLTGDRHEEDPAPALTVEIVGEQWWWRVHYLDGQGRVDVASANEVRLPVGQPVMLRLRTADVLHSLWVPRIAGKLDMVPGHVNHLRVQATSPGVSRGQCAEFCGGEHAWMALHVLAMPPAEHARWLARARGPAAAPRSDLTRRGAAAFRAGGCAQCHTVRGTAAAGTLGPDLSRVGERLTIAAGRLPNHRGTLAAWIASSQHLKPGNAMPSFRGYAGRDLRALAHYLEELR